MFFYLCSLDKREIVWALSQYVQLVSEKAHKQQGTDVKSCSEFTVADKIMPCMTSAAGVDCLRLPWNNSFIYNFIQ